MLHEIFKYKYPVYYHIAVKDILNRIDSFIKILSLKIIYNINNSIF